VGKNGSIEAPGGATAMQDPYNPGKATDVSSATFSHPDNNYFLPVSPT